MAPFVSAFSWTFESCPFIHCVSICRSTHVISEDTVCRRVVGHKMFSTRLITKKNNYKLPRWAERFLPASKHICIVEESVIDSKNKTLTTYTRNIVMTRVMVRRKSELTVEVGGWVQVSLRIFFFFESARNP